MNRLDDTHPALEQLVAFGIGGVPGEAATAIEAHLSQCPTCCDVVAKPRDDELVRLVRTSKSVRNANQTALRLQLGYEILEELGRGGMGVVYKARQAGLHRLVALKQALSGGDAEEFVRFRREAEAAARLHHPNIVQIYEVGEQDGVPYLAMEYVEGGTLAAHLDGTPVAPRFTAELVATLARATHHAHQHGVVHRDLKPENILLASGGCEPPVVASLTGGLHPPLTNGVVPKIADFGLAKLLDRADGKTQTGAILGTPKYMAPEQATGTAGQIGPATDVHALGVLLYEMLTGRVPYAGATILETLEQVCSHEPAAPRRLQPRVPRELETICLKALAKEPARRYASADAMAEDLTRFLDGRPILARPASSFERLVKAIRRRPAWATLVSFAVLMVLGSVGGVLYHNAQLREQVERADTQAAVAIQEKERADTQYQQARLTLLRMLEALDKQGAESIPQVLELRRTQSEQALAFFESIGAGEDDANPRQRADLATACKEAARLQIALGRPAPAEQNLRRAIRLLEDLDVEAADDREPRETLAACFDLLGVMLGNIPGRGEEAVSCGRKAVALNERLVRDYPNEVRLKHNLAHACDNLGTLYRTHPGGSHVELYERSLNLLRELHEAHPDRVEFAVGLAETCSNLGSVYWGNQQLDKAAAVYKEALGILEPLAAAHPGHVWYASTLASLRINLGGMWATQGRLGEALQQYDRALAALQDILRREPNHAQAQGNLLPAHGGRAQALSRLGRYADSVKDWDRVIALAPIANRPAYRLERAGVLIQAGDLDKAAAEADEVAGAAKVEPVYFYEAGYLHTRISKALVGKPSQAEAHAARAVVWLQKASDAGFFEKPDHAAYLKHRDFSILRSRADFEKLLRAATKTLPKAKQ